MSFSQATQSSYSQQDVDAAYGRIKALGKKLEEEAKSSLPPAINLGEFLNGINMKLALSLAARYKLEHVVSIMLTDEKIRGETGLSQGGHSALQHAAKGGHAGIVKMLLDHKAKPNENGSDGYTPLIHAVDKGHMDVVELLLDNKADPHQKSSDDKLTAYIRATQKEDYEAISLLAFGRKLVTPEREAVLFVPGNIPKNSELDDLEVYRPADQYKDDLERSADIQKLAQELRANAALFLKKR